MVMNWFKAENDNDRSGDILVSFDAKWDAGFKNENIRYVFRKRVPTAFKPKDMYIYISSPIKTLIGRARIKSVKKLPADNSLEFAKGAAISQEELKEYIGTYEEVGIYEIDRIHLFSCPVPLDYLQSKTGFTPPQSFVALSHRASELLQKKYEAEK